MKIIKTIGILIVVVVVVSAGFTVNVVAEDLWVHALSPGYEIVVGKDVFFDWSRSDGNNNPQSKFTLGTSAGNLTIVGSEMKYIWENFPFGTGTWNVEVWRDCWLFSPCYIWVGKTSLQNFYHYNNVSNTTNYRPEPFEYRRGARDLAQSRDLTIFYELTKDYMINLNKYFSLANSFPGASIVWESTPDQVLDLYRHLRSLREIESDFIKLNDGVLTLKKGYRWDGTSNPFVWEEDPTDLRSSCVHDALYDLMRMGYLTADRGFATWNDPGYMNRLMADIMHYMIAVEDKDKTEFWAYSDFVVLRSGGQSNTYNDSLLRAFKFRVSELTAWVTEDGDIDLHWRPANMADDDPKDYHMEPHHYDIFRTTSDSSNWSYIGTKTFYPDDMGYHTDATIYFTDPNVTIGEIYYYWIRANDPDSDGDGWTDQEEKDYIPSVPGNIPIPPNLLIDFKTYDIKHYDESGVEAVAPAIGHGNALQLNGIDQYTLSTSESGITSGNNWTFEAWVYPEEGDNLGTILHVSDPASSIFNSLMYSNQTYQFCYSMGSVNDPNILSRCTEEGLITPGRWYHLAVSINGNEIVIYVDGVPEATFEVPEYEPLYERVPTFGIGATCYKNIGWDPEGGEYKTGALAYKINPIDFFNTDFREALTVIEI